MRMPPPHEGAACPKILPELSPPWAGMEVLCAGKQTAWRPPRGKHRCLPRQGTPVCCKQAFCFAKPLAIAHCMAGLRKSSLRLCRDRQFSLLRENAGPALGPQCLCRCSGMRPPIFQRRFPAERRLRQTCFFTYIFSGEKREKSG